jgi:periplasmic copper chaperone A
MGPRAIALVLVALTGVAWATHPLHAQRSVRISKAWVTLPAGAAAPALAFAVVENGTMYDVYLVRAESDASGTLTLQETAGGKTGVVKEVMVPAFGQLEMSPTGVHLLLSTVKRPLKSGETIPLTLYLDDGTAITAEAVVK